jgi:hypothetical protein
MVKQESRIAESFERRGRKSSVCEVKSEAVSFLNQSQAKLLGAPFAASDSGYNKGGSRIVGTLSTNRVLPTVSPHILRATFLIRRASVTGIQDSCEHCKVCCQHCKDAPYQHQDCLLTRRSKCGHVREGRGFGTLSSEAGKRCLFPMYGIHPKHSETAVGCREGKACLREGFGTGTSRSDRW